MIIQVWNSKKFHIVKEGVWNIMKIVLKNRAKVLIEMTIKRTSLLSLIGGMGERWGGESDCQFFRSSPLVFSTLTVGGLKLSIEILSSNKNFSALQTGKLILKPLVDSHLHCAIWIEESNELRCYMYIQNRGEKRAVRKFF